MRILVVEDEPTLAAQLADALHAAGLRLAIELDVVVDRGEAEVEAAAELAVVVELALGPDVQLHPVQQGERIAELGL